MAENSRDVATENFKTWTKDWSLPDWVLNDVFLYFGLFLSLIFFIWALFFQKGNKKGSDIVSVGGDFIVSTELTEDERIQRYGFKNQIFSVTLTNNTEVYLDNLELWLRVSSRFMDDKETQITLPRKLNQLPHLPPKTTQAIDAFGEIQFQTKGITNDGNTYHYGGGGGFYSPVSPIVEFYNGFGRTVSFIFEIRDGHNIIKRFALEFSKHGLTLNNNYSLPENTSNVVVTSVLYEDMIIGAVREAQERADSYKAKNEES